MEAAPGQRIDKWLWYARFFKTRGLSAGQVTAGHVRINGDKASKAAQVVRAGDVLTFAQGKRIRVVKVLALGTRRGPAPEAQTLFEDLTPEREKDPSAPKREGQGRPTKKARRDLDLHRARTLE